MLSLLSASHTDFGGRWERVTVASASSGHTPGSGHVECKGFLPAGYDYCCGNLDPGPMVDLPTKLSSLMPL